jgi:nitrate reductase molybdenum cofactor assembly chaperone NarJ/NarW
MNRTLRALAALLSYPDEEFLEALPQLEAFVPGSVSGLARELKKQDLLESQERYVALFDRSRALSLNLFEHVHGESRDRGQAMVDLQAMYAARGLAVAGHELPDYVPAFLEFLSLLPPGESQKLLVETSHILRILGDRLAERGSPYATVFAALLELAGEAGLSKALVARPAAEDDRAALDAQWMDPEVTFGPKPGVEPVRFYPNGYRNGVPA